MLYLYHTNKLGNMNYYIDYLDCKNKFKKTRKHFESNDKAYQWMVANFEKWDIDWIKCI